jgi:hypothetical protein
VRNQLLDIVNGHATHVCVSMQGNGGTFSVEATINRNAHFLPEVQDRDC